jgi:drug/metabolite transporter (DMT)-like permease
MSTLLLSIFASSIVFAIFKLFDRFDVDIFQAVVMNYSTAAGCGFVIFSNQWPFGAGLNSDWIYWSGFAACIFLSLFSLMAISSQKNGVGVTSVAVKMSLALSMVCLSLMYHEVMAVTKVVGVCCALLGVGLVTFQRGTAKTTIFWMPLVLFLGSALLDVMLNYVQHEVLQGVAPAIFAATCFACAGIMGSLIVGIRSILGISNVCLRSVLAGVFLGIPNFFSIYLLMESYRDVPWTDSSVLGVTNVGIVVVTTLIGRVFFREILSIRQVAGLASAAVAILLLSSY